MKLNPFQHCPVCYPRPSAGPDEFYEDPSTDCVHSSSRDFFHQLESHFPTLSPDSRLAVILKSRPEASGFVPGMNLFGFLCLSSWYRDMPRIPRFPPVCKTPGAWTLHFLNTMAEKYRHWELLMPSSLPDIIGSFKQMHGVTPNEGIFVDHNMPLARQWLPCYAPAFYHGTYVAQWKYHSVPVSPSIYTLQHFDGYVLPQSLAKSAECLAESRKAVSDTELERRIDDLVQRLRYFSPGVRAAADEAFYYVADVQMLLDRYRLELLLRRDRSTTLVLASYQYATSPAYSTVYGGCSTEPSFSAQFRQAVQRLAKNNPMIYRNVPLPLEPGVIEMANRAYARCLSGGPLDDAIDYGELISLALCNRLTPGTIWQFLRASVAEKPRNPVEYLLKCYFMAIFNKKI